VREALEDNLRRCTAHHNIIRSVLAAAEAPEKGAQLTGVAENAEVSA
jgi:xanthine dehydrogenase iron-sulfur cluster and FAD-binding subunit A